VKKTKIGVIIATAILLFSFAACEREERGFRVQPPDSNRTTLTRPTNFEAGQATTPTEFQNEYENNAFAMSEGKRLFSQMNCVGCHAHGGGAIGPALMDDKWIYGSQPDQIFSTIVEGRPNGMPSFRGKLPDYEIWQLAAYVRSLSGKASSNSAPGRDESLHMSTPENSVKGDKKKPLGSDSTTEAKP
jgi:cytochrome c oxidase cbb3-type subunit III